MRRLVELHDLTVVAVALIILGIGAVLAAGQERPARKRYETDGLSMQVPAAWLREPAEGGALFRGEDAVTRLEIRREERAEGPGLTLDAQLELRRGQTYGQMYQRLATERRTVSGTDCLRTQYAYAFKPSGEHAPRLASAVELACAAGGRLWVVTLHGPEDRVRELEPWVLGTVEVTR